MILFPSAITEDTDTAVKIINDEFHDIFLKFCSFISILHNKKLNLSNIFILLLKNDEYLQLYKSLTHIETDYEAFKSFLSFDSSIQKSKMLKRHLSEFAERHDYKFR